MKFESYPHDIQVCSMMIESCKTASINVYFEILTKHFNCFNCLVSHTVHDLVFIWNMTDPLVVNDEIELPQLDISNNYTMDCTIPYSTGRYVRSCALAFVLSLKLLSQVILRVSRSCLI